MRIKTLLGMLAALAITFVATVAAIPMAPASAADHQAASRIHALINDYRAKHALPPLEWNESLAGVAGAWTEQSAAVANVQGAGSFMHNPSFAQQYPAGALSWSENIAWSMSADQSFQWWANSAPHRANMLRGADTDIGIAVVQLTAGPNKGVYLATANFGQYQATADRRAAADRQAEVDRQAKAEAERQAQAEADRQAQAEADRQAKAEADRQAKAEADRQAKAEADRQAKAEADRQAKAEADRQARAEADRQAEAERQAAADRQAGDDAEAAADSAATEKAEAERVAAEKAEAERAAAERAEAERAAAEKAEAERAAAEQAAAEAAAAEAARQAGEVGVQSSEQDTADAGAAATGSQGQTDGTASAVQNETDSAALAEADTAPGANGNDTERSSDGAGTGGSTEQAGTPTNGQSTDAADDHAPGIPQTIQYSDAAALTADTSGGFTADARGSRVTLTGLTPGESYQVFFHSEPLNMGLVAADESGRIELAVPADLAAGEHKVAVYLDGQLVGWQPFAVEAAVTVLPAGAAEDTTRATLANTGISKGQLLVGGLGTLLLAGGIGVLLIVHRGSQSIRAGQL